MSDTTDHKRRSAKTLHLTLPQIRAFERTVRLGGVHATARYLGLTQPAVSQRIRELERSLGVKLLVRQGRSLRMTPDGAAVLTYADQLLKIAEEMALRIGTDDPLRGTLRLGVSKSFALICLPKLVKKITERHKSLKMSIQIGDSNSINDMLNNLNLDLAVTSEYKMEDHVKREPIGMNVHGWFAAPDYAADDLVVRAADLARHHLIVTPPPSRHNAIVMQWFRRANVVPQQLSTCDDMSVTVRMILDGIGIGFVPTRIMRDELREGAVRQLIVEPALPAHQVWICYQVEELGPGLRDVVDLVHEVLAEEQLYV